MLYRSNEVLLWVLLTVMVSACNEFSRNTLSYKVTKGKSLFDGKYISLDASFNGGSFFAFQIVFDGMKERLVFERELELRTVFSSKSTGVFLDTTFRAKTENGTNNVSKYTALFKLFPQYYHRLKAGNHTVHMRVMTRLTDRLNKKKWVKSPYHFEVDIPVSISEVYKTKVYFHTLILDKEQTMKKLMRLSVFSKNDFLDETPEACIRLSYMGQPLWSCYARNSIKLVCPKAFDLYYVKGKEDLKIEVLDKDYFPNPNDHINDTTVTVSYLQSNTYKDLPLHCTNQLLIYTKGKQKVN